MARVVKKEKGIKNKQNTNSKPSALPKILGVLAGVLLVGLVVVGVVFFVKDNYVSSKYSNSRSMDYDTIVNVIMENDRERNDYENEFYIYIFHSDFEQYPENVLSDTTEDKLQSLIKKDLRLFSLYNTNNVSNSNRLGFYTLDLKDEDNLDILNNSLFGDKEEGSFFLTVSGKEVKVKSGSNATIINDIIFDLDLEIENNQNK